MHRERDVFSKGDIQLGYCKQHLYLDLTEWWSWVYSVTGIFNWCFDWKDLHKPPLNLKTFWNITNVSVMYIYLKRAKIRMGNIANFWWCCNKQVCIGQLVKRRCLSWCVYRVLSKIQVLFFFQARAKNEYLSFKIKTFYCD